MEEVYHVTSVPKAYIDETQHSKCSNIFMKQLTIRPPHPVTRYTLVRLLVKLTGFSLPLTTIINLRMTAGTYGETRFSV